ncbi:MAG: uracil-DNA glycosylase [Vicinamibacterales bacterium]
MAGAGDLPAIRQAIESCDRCRRLRLYCARIARDKKAAHRHEPYWGRPVAGFGDPHARVLVLGLAPAAHGGNRTGRPFTGDGSSDFLMHAMHATGFANIPTSQHRDDGLRLRDAYIAAAARCAPPANKPTADELANCFPHLRREFDALRRVRVVVALGRVASDSYWKLLADLGHPLPKPRPAFGHARIFEPGLGRDGARAPTLVESYHPSRQNTNTGRLTRAMLVTVFREARRLAGHP